MRSGECKPGRQMVELRGLVLRPQIYANSHAQERQKPPYDAHKNACAG